VLTDQPVAAVAGPPARDDLTDRELLRQYAAGGDGEAFAVLLRRHGPMVWGVCRRVLRHRQDAEDAFQATFLVLARKAATLRQPELLGNWLYGVASRVARKARRRAAARAADPERQAEPMAPLAEPVLALAYQELQRILDEEINRLPEKYRAPLVLCYLQGLTYEQAAVALHRPLGSMSWLLAQAREALRRRLVRRGLAVSAGVIALLAAVGRAEAVPRSLEAGALAVAGGQASAEVAALAEAGLGVTALALGRWRFGLLLLALLLALPVAACTYAHLAAPAKAPPPAGCGHQKSQDVHSAPNQDQDSPAGRLRP
jgi:RNA polymerase sigma factor (sigma-70 family)